KHVEQLAQGLGALGVGLVADFVAGAPQYDARVIAVAMDEVLDVALVPLVEIVGVAIGADLALADLPLVERLVHHQEAHAVAEVHEFGGVGIVAGADGVAAHLAQDFEAALPDALRDGGADASGLMVQADAVELDAFAVEQESLVGVEDGFADAGGGDILVHHAVLVAERGVDFVEIGIGHAPEAGLRDAHLLHEFIFARGSNLLGSFGGLDRLPVSIQQSGGQHARGGGFALVLHAGLDLNHGGVLGDARRSDEGAPIGHVELVGGQQPGVTVDAGARIPAAIGLAGVVDFDGDHVVAGVEQRREIVREGDEAVGALAQILAVDPHFAVLIDAVELDDDDAVVVGLGHAEALAIPADAGRKAPLGFLLLAVGALDAPIVGQVDGAPGGIGELGLLGAGRVSLEELPTEVKGLADSRCGAGGLILGVQCGDKRRAGDRLAKQAAAGESWWIHGPLLMVGQALSFRLPTLVREKLAGGSACPTF